MLLVEPSIWCSAVKPTHRFRWISQQQIWLFDFNRHLNSGSWISDVHAIARAIPTRLNGSPMEEQRQPFPSPTRARWRRLVLRSPHPRCNRVVLCSSHCPEISREPIRRLHKYGRRCTKDRSMNVLFSDRSVCWWLSFTMHKHRCL